MGGARCLFFFSLIEILIIKWETFFLLKVFSLPVPGDREGGRAYRGGEEGGGRDEGGGGGEEES